MVEYWDEEAGDTHELLGARELLAERDLTDEQRLEMEKVDAVVLDLVSNINTKTWDTLMLQDTATLIRAEHASPPLRQAI